MIPPAFGLKDVALETYTAEGPISYWNAYVAVTQMGGHGNFKDDALKIDVKHSPDMVTSKLPALRDYQFTAWRRPRSPRPRSMATPPRAARRCSTRTARAATSAAMAPTMTAANCIRASETGTDGAYAERTKGRCIARRRCADCGSTRRTSMTAAPEQLDDGGPLQPDVEPRAQ